MAKQTQRPETASNDDGVRPARFGLKTLLAAVGLAVLTTVFAVKIFGGGDSPAATPKAPPVEPSPTVIPIAEPSFHPLEGRRQIHSASIGRWRYAYLSWTGGLIDVGYPLATLEHDDPCVWELVGESGRRDVYRILCRTGQANGKAALSYTHFAGRDFPLATVETNDPMLWKITPISTASDTYKIICYDDSDWHADELSWETDHKFRSANYPIVTVEENDPTSWLILADGAPLPTPAAPVTHVIIYPRRDIADDALETLTEWAEEIATHIEDRGNRTLKLHLWLRDGNEIKSTYAGMAFKAAAEQLRKAGDPVAGLLPGSFSAGSNPISNLVTDAVGDDRKLEPFPLVLPVLSSGTLAVESIERLHFEDEGFRYNDTLEKIDDFQSLLDDSKSAAGRVFHGTDYFTYVFVNLTAAQ